MSDVVVLEALVNFGLAEPHLVEVHAQSDVEVVFFDKGGGVGLAVEPSEGEIHHSLKSWYGHPETTVQPPFAQAVGADFEIRVFVRAAESILYATEI